MNSNELTPESNEQFVRSWERDGERVATTWVADIQRNRVQRGCSPLLAEREHEIFIAINRIFGQLSPASQELWKATATMAFTAQGRLPEVSTEDSAGDPEITVNENLEPGCRVHLREDVTVPRRVYVFEMYDSDAPADANCMVVDVQTGDWTMRGFAELVPVDEDSDGTAEEH